MGQMLTAKQVAEVKGCSYQYVKRIIKEGKLQAQEILNDKTERPIWCRWRLWTRNYSRNGIR